MALFRRIPHDSYSTPVSATRARGRSREDHNHHNPHILVELNRCRCYPAKKIWDERNSFMIKEGRFTLLEKRGAVAKVTINRPDKRNALSRATIREILA